MKKLYPLIVALLLASSFSAFSQTVTGSFNFGGLSRGYRVHIPPTYTGNNPVPLVFNLHGITSNAIQQELYSDMNSVADTAGFIVCYADGFNNAWNSGFTSPYFGGVDDVGFISVLIDSISAQYNIDPSRVYSCGMSNGGFMSFRLACELEDRIAAIASVTGTMTTLQTDNCVPSRPMPVLQIHGTLDPTVAYGGNSLSLPIDSVLNYWRVANGCTAAVVNTNLPDVVLEGSTVSTQLYAGCTDGVEVLHYKVDNGGHTWPGAFPIPTGITNQDIDASEEIWKFFKRFSHPNPVLVGVESQEQGPSFPSIGPNPVRNKLFLRGIRSNLAIEILDVNGRTIFAATVYEEGDFEIETSNWAAGIYLLRMSGQGQNDWKKLVVSP